VILFIFVVIFFAVFCFAFFALSVTTSYAVHKMPMVSRTRTNVFPEEQSI